MDYQRKEAKYLIAQAAFPEPKTAMYFEVAQNLENMKFHLAPNVIWCPVKTLHTSTSETANAIT
jgi:hypothetical protein